MGYVNSNPLASKTLGYGDSRATTAEWVKDYIAFELDDARGAPMRYEVLDLVTNT